MGLKSILLPNVLIRAGFCPRFGEHAWRNVNGGDLCIRPRQHQSVAPGPTPCIANPQASYIHRELFDSVMLQDDAYAFPGLFAYAADTSTPNPDRILFTRVNRGMGDSY